MEEIYNFVKVNTGIGIGGIQARGREARLVYARVLFSYIAVRKMNYAFSVVAREIQKDHTTIMHQVKLAEKSIKIRMIADKFKSKGGGFKDRLKSNLRGQNYSKLYQEIYNLYGGRCGVCKFSAVLEICHIIPRYIGGPESKENLVVLCPNHHAMFDRGLLKIEDIHIEI